MVVFLDMNDTPQRWIAYILGTIGLVAATITGVILYADSQTPEAKFMSYMEDETDIWEWDTTAIGLAEVVCREFVEEGRPRSEAVRYLRDGQRDYITYKVPGGSNGDLSSHRISNDDAEALVTAAEEYVCPHDD